MRLPPLAVLIPLLFGSAHASAQQSRPAEPGRLPTGVSLAPVGASLGLGSMPLSITLSPDGRRAVVVLSGWRGQGIQVVDVHRHAVVQTLLQPAAFLGAAFAPDGRTLYVSGGDRDVVYRYDWREGLARLRDSLDLTPEGPPRRHGVRYPAGLAPSPDGRFLYVAENLADSLAVVDVASGRVVDRLATERYPYDVRVTPQGAVYVSAWGGHTVSVFRPNGSGRIEAVGTIPAGRHPSALALDRDGTRLFVASGSTDRIAVVDTRRNEVVAQLADPAPAGPSEGSTPDALAVSVDGRRLFVAEADNNAVSVFDLEGDSLLGRVPVGWYPTAVAVAGDTLLVVNGKGLGSAPNPGLPQPGQRGNRAPNYTLGQIPGTLSWIADTEARGASLRGHSETVARLNNWDRTRTAPSYPPFEHVIYIIKENRTYDQVLGDLPEGDGDTSLVFFPRPISPNHHALAERFGTFDRFFVNAEVSADGHNWSMGAYASDYVEKTTPSNYGSGGRSYDYEGENRGWIPADQGAEDAAEPANGYLWNLAQRAGITFRNYGEFVAPGGMGEVEDLPPGYRGTKPYLDAHTNTDFPGFDLGIQDRTRVEVWLKEFHEYEVRGSLPALEVMHLPSDHTSGPPGPTWPTTTSRSAASSKRSRRAPSGPPP